MENHAIEELIEFLGQEKERIVATFPWERRRGLFELTRSLDYLYAHRSLFHERPSEEMDDLYQLCSYGWGTALDLFMDDSCKRTGVPGAPSLSESRNWADSVLQHCGRMGMCRLWIDLCKAKLVDLNKIGENEYHFLLADGPIGIESIERQDFQWLNSLVNRHDAASWDRLAPLKQEISTLMPSLVRPWREHFIAYDADPSVDVFFQHAGLLYSRLMHGQDAFPGNAMFGGLTFDYYRAAVVILVGWAMRHIHFCYHLLNTHSGLQPRNLITIWCEIGRFAENLAAALEIEDAAAEQVLGALTLTLDSKKVHCRIPAGPPAPLIEIGARQVLHSIYGSLNSPFSFLLNELKRKYRKDWDHAVNLREQVFRKELYELFPQEHILKIDRSVEIKKNDVVLTDIDAILFDRRTGIVGLFQLKWQDAFGNSIQERESKKTNLLTTCNKWVDRVTAYIGENDRETSAVKLGLGRYKAEVKGFRLFVIGRNAAHFSGDGVPNAAAAWGMWPQVLRLAAESYDLSHPIEGLFRALKADSPLLKRISRLERESIKLGSKVIWIEARESETTAASGSGEG